MGIESIIQRCLLIDRCYCNVIGDKGRVGHNGDNDKKDKRILILFCLMDKYTTYSYIKII